MLSYDFDMMSGMTLKQLRILRGSRARPTTRQRRRGAAPQPG
jgi:hypothetical protein